jgi:molybdopterin molybdotransferase
VSVGDHDVVRPALERAGVELSFWKVAMKPGKPLAVGRRGATHVLGLPGNPVSALVTFLLFGMPLIRALAGDRAPLPRPLRARLTRDVARSPGRTEFARVTLDQDGDEPTATPLANQASGAMIALATCDGLAVIPAELGNVPAGTWVSVIRLADA